MGATTATGLTTSNLQPSLSLSLSPDRTPQASSTRTSLAADRGRYDTANPAPSARDVWLLKVEGRDLGARRNLGEDMNFNGDSGP